MQLRPYQQEAKDAIFVEWDKKDNRRTLIVLPTGTGKTIVFSAVIAERVAAGERVLVLASALLVRMELSAHRRMGRP